jgi:hypothetical protein
MNTKKVVQLNLTPTNCPIFQNQKLLFIKNSENFKEIITVERVFPKLNYCNLNQDEPLMYYVPSHTLPPLYRLLGSEGTRIYFLPENKFYGVVSKKDGSYTRALKAKVGWEGCSNVTKTYEVYWLLPDEAFSTIESVMEIEL